MVTIYGCSDDLVEIEGSEYYENEIGCYDQDVRIWFKDGTVIRVGYPKPEMSVWWIKVESVGTEWWDVLICEDEDADVYSDVFTINSEIEKHEVIDKEE